MLRPNGLNSSDERMDKTTGIYSAASSYHANTPHREAASRDGFAASKGCEVTNGSRAASRAMVHRKAGETTTLSLENRLILTLSHPQIESL
jgi:hypothetical protein